MKNAHGKVIKYGDNVDTDVIIPARYLNSSDPAELAAHCMEDIDADFVKNVKKGDIIVADKDFADNEAISKHKAWFEEFKDNYTFTPENTEDILKKEIGRTFERVLEDAGVYKQTPDGLAAFTRFAESVK